MKSSVIGTIVLAGTLLGAAGDDNRTVSDHRIISADDISASGMTHGVLGTAHDFGILRGRPGNPCQTCHVPHTRAVRVTTQPSTQPAGEMYLVEGQRRVFVPDRYTPGPASLLCLGCHDGTVATSTIGASHALLAGVREGFTVPEGFVWRDHPIGIPYPNDRKGFRPESFVKKKGGIRLPEGRIECISCHDPHNRLGVIHLLRTSNRRSRLCLSCHIK